MKGKELLSFSLVRKARYYCKDKILIMFLQHCIPHPFFASFLIF